MRRLTQCNVGLWSELQRDFLRAAGLDPGTDSMPNKNQGSR